MKESHNILLGIVDFEKFRTYLKTNKIYFKSSNIGIHAIDIVFKTDKEKFKGCKEFLESL